MFFQALRSALCRLRKREKTNPTTERCERKTPPEKEVDRSHRETNNNDGMSLLITELPSLIIMEILSRLPVRDIIRARGVSKTWSDLIADPYFAQLHLSRAPPSYTRMASCEETPNITRFLLADVERDESRGYFVRGRHLNHRFSLPGDCLELKASCNGLLCIGGPKTSDRDVVYVCNPLLGEYTILPEIGYERYERFILGFGFTRTSCRDYKVLQCVCDLDSENYVLQVHKLGTRTWKKLKGVPFSVSPGTFLNGSLHWVSTLVPYKFVSFDLQSEQFKPFPGPSILLDDICQTFLRVSGGLMCLLLVKPGNWNLQLWMMKEYGVKESWTKINTILWDPFAAHFLWTDPVHLLDYGPRGGDELGKDVLVVIVGKGNGIWIVRGNEWDSCRVSTPVEKNLVVYHLEGDIAREAYSYGPEDWSDFPADAATSLVSLRNIVGEDNLITA